MKKKLVERLMHERVSGLKGTDGYFIRGDFDDILSGVLLDYTPSGVYIYDFKFPLFDFSGPNLTFSDRIKGRPFIEKEEMSEQSLVDYILASPEGATAFAKDSSMSVRAFAGYLVESNKCVRAPHARLIFASALILLAQESQAAEILRELPPKLHRTDVPHCNSLSERLRQGPEHARALLRQFKDENLKAFALS